MILVNSNPATIMTDRTSPARRTSNRSPPRPWPQSSPGSAPARCCPMGGQTGLNVAAELARTGVLTRFGVELVGASAEVIARAEDRLIFRETMQAAGLDVLRSVLASSLEEAEAFAREAGYPVIVRPSFTLGGSGGGVAYNHAELVRIVRSGLAASPVRTVLVEESALGWKEFELEVMHDKAGNAVIVCSIENLDRWACTRRPLQWRLARPPDGNIKPCNAALTCIRAVGIETGSDVRLPSTPHGPHGGRRDESPGVPLFGLASKATGAIAKVAALVAVGYTLDEIRTISRRVPRPRSSRRRYCVVKVPPFDFASFGGWAALGTQMKAVTRSWPSGAPSKHCRRLCGRSRSAGQG